MPGWTTRRAHGIPGWNGNRPEARMPSSWRRSGPSPIAEVPPTGTGCRSSRRARRSKRTSTGSVVLAPGTTNTVKVRVRGLRGHTNAVTAFLRDLPTGVMGASRTLEPSDTEPVLELVAAADAAAFQGPVRVVLAEGNGGAETAVPFELTTRGENNGVPRGTAGLVVDRTDRLWLTVRTNRPAAAPAGDGK